MINCPNEDFKQKLFQITPTWAECKAQFWPYFFLNRSKPSTHIAVLSKLDDEAVGSNIPPVLKRLISAAGQLLKGDKNENCTS